MKPLVILVVIIGTMSGWEFARAGDDRDLGIEKHQESQIFQPITVPLSSFVKSVKDTGHTQDPFEMHQVLPRSKEGNHEENADAVQKVKKIKMASVDYDIVYVRSPRYGDDKNTDWPEVGNPIQMEPRSDLILLHPDGTEEILVLGEDGAIVDPFVSFDGEWVYYAKFPNVEKRKARGVRAPAEGSDIYKIHIPSRKIVRLTFQEWIPNTGAGDWSGDHLSGSFGGGNYLGYGIFNLGPSPLPGGRIIFSSSRNGFLPSKDFSFPNLQLFVMDDDGNNVEQIGHLNLGSALHPTVLMDGRVMFASWEGQGLRDQRLWGLWAIWPDGRMWEPLLSAFEDSTAFHFQSQLSDGTIIIEEYYNKNNNGFGTFLSLPPRPPLGEPPFGDPNPSHESNPRIERGKYKNGKTRWERYSFSPKGLGTLTPFTHGKDNSSGKDDQGEWMGKVTHPSGAPNNDLLLVWTPGPANNLNRPTRYPYYDGGLYLLKGGRPVSHPRDLLLVKNDPAFNEMQPRAVVPYRVIYGVEEPKDLPWLPNDGTLSPQLPEGTPFGLVGTSSFYKRNTGPGFGKTAFNGLDSFNTAESEASSNWRLQGADAGKYANEDIFAVRILAMEPTSHRNYGPNEGRNFFNHGNERLRILGEIPLRKVDLNGKPIVDADGNPDTSFLAKIPADVPYTFQTLDRDGLVLNMSQTWHQVRPGEIRNDCGGCHAHAQMGTDFATTVAAKPDFVVPDLTANTPLLSKDSSGNPVVKSQQGGAVDVEYYRDIKPILQRSCVACHSGIDAGAGLVLDDEELVDGYENTYYRLANDPSGKFGPPSMIKKGNWRESNASRYIRKYQSRRSLLIWKIFGRRLDGWSNADHPTESIPGDKSTFPKGSNPNDGDIDFVGTIMPPPGSDVPPLTEDEKILFARWVDLGAPINSNERGRKDYGWFLDDLRPTLTLSIPRSGANVQPVKTIRIGAYDYYSGLDARSFSVKANFPVNGEAAGTELSSLFQTSGDHIWTLPIDPPITALPDGQITVSVRDRQGNITTISRKFRISPPAWK